MNKTPEDDIFSDLDALGKSPPPPKLTLEQRMMGRVDRHSWDIPWETRLAVLVRAKGHCEEEGCCRHGVDMHHVDAEAYERKATKAERPEDLQLLCREHHADQHPWMQRL